MIAYEFYLRDETGKDHLIGILPERREKPERVTNKSIFNWIENVIDGHLDIRNIYFVRVETWGVPPQNVHPIAP